MQGESLLQRAGQFTRLPVIVVSITALLGLVALYILSLPATTQAHHGAPAVAGLSATRVATFLLTWTAMSAAMMLPSALSLLLSIERISHNHPRGRLLPLCAALAYLLVWAMVGVLVLVLSEAARLFVRPHVSAEAANWVNGACLVAAGLFGMSPFANSCLRACRRPFGFLAQHWHGGDTAVRQVGRIGFSYGLSCVGCCVPMLALMFVVGMANIAWVVVLGALMVAIKSSIYGVQVARLLAIAAIVSGVGVALGWLVLPGHLH